MRFNSKLVRLKVNDTRDPNRIHQFRVCFNSKLVRLKGYVKTIIRLYAILMGRVKSSFRNVIFQVNLLSTCSSANSLGG